MSWDFDNKNPIYIQIMEIIKTNIVSGKLIPGSKLASVREMAVDAGVNPNTMQRALSELEHEGFLFSQRTSGRFITYDKQKIYDISQELAYNYIKTMVDSITSMGYPIGEVSGLVKKYLDEKSNII